MSRSIILDIPFPPSVNQIYPTNFKTKMRFRSKKYTAWQSEVFKLLRLRNVGHIGGDVVAEYVFEKPDNRKRDVENYAKAVSDTLVKGGVITDDSNIIDLRLRWGDAPGGARITVRAA